MKKIIIWIFLITLFVFILDWGVMGVKLLNHNYNIMTEAYIGLISWLILIITGIGRIVTAKCPHCQKVLLIKGKYCPHCGKER